MQNGTEANTRLPERQLVNGAELQDLRKRLDVTIAEAASEIGLSKNTVVDVEQGRVPDEEAWREAIKAVASRKMQEKQAAIAAA